jgi:hypothetical protein
MQSNECVVLCSEQEHFPADINQFLDILMADIRNKNTQ